MFGSITFSNGELERLDREALDDDRDIDIQSCSSLCPKGFAGR
jgi:hypothetical protein